MNAIIAVIIYIIAGILLSRLTRLIGLKIFRFSEIHNLCLKHLKKEQE